MKVDKGVEEEEEEEEVVENTVWHGDDSVKDKGDGEKAE